ncbi:MAG TPA: hypothetical protein VGM23_12475 [Armatimonadota bacterium]|jgi:hypothetical protein
MRNNICLSALLLLLTLQLAHAGGGRNRVAGSEATMSPVRTPVQVDGDLDEWDIAQAKLLTLFVGGGEDTRSEVPLEKYSAKIALQYDKDALYVGVWYTDPTPLGPEKSAGYVPLGDGLILDLPLSPMRHVACWRAPGGTAKHAVLSIGNVPLAQGKEMPGVTQGFKVTGKSSYTQEIRIPWRDLGGQLTPGLVARLGVELCFGGMDAAAGYKAWRRDNLAGVSSDGNRWGGYMCWGFVDGLRSTELVAPSFDPATGALVTLAPAGTHAQPNLPVMYAGNEQTRTTNMIAVPAGKITIDGKMTPGEWDDKSATTIASEPTLFPQRYAVDVLWAYAPRGLYAGFRWHTGGPHLNINDPAALNRGYDGGDALQIRLGTDRVSHVDAWYYDAKQQPAMNIGYGVRFNEGLVPDALANGAQMAIQPTPGGGYTEEIFLPWTLITQKGLALKEKDTFRVVLDVFFSGLEGNRLPFIINTRIAQPTGVVALPFIAPADGFYTVVIENPAQQRIIRHLLTYTKLRKGQRVAEWDGLDDGGQPVSAGAYRFRGLYHQGIGTKYLMTYNNPGNPPWQNDAGTGEWGGDHAPPQAVATDGDRVFLGWPAAEDGNGIIACDLQGQKRWGFFGTPANQGYGDSGAAYVAVDNGKVYFASEVRINNPSANAKPALAYFKTSVACLDTANGLRSGMSIKEPFTVIGMHDTTQVQTNWWWDLWQKKDFSLDTNAIHDDYFFSYHCVGGNLTGLAARDGKLYVSLRVRNEIAVYSSADMKELAHWPLPKPGGLAFSPDGTLYAVSDKSVVRVDLASGAATPVVTAGLEAPVALALDRTGTIFVSDWGAAQCVKVFDRTGKATRTVGLPGGRAWIGAYNANGMLLPRGIAIDREGKLWVAEDDNMPRRISVWEASTGKLLKEYVGGTIYGAVNGGMLDPKNPTRAISAGVWFDIDLTKEGYRPVTTMWRRFSREQYFSFGPAAGSNSPPSVRFLEVNGRRLMLSNQNNAAVIGELQADGTWKPLAAVGGASTRRDGADALADDKLIWRMSPSPAFFPAHAGENYVWMDLNGDGAVQAEEMQWRKQDRENFPCLGAYWGAGMVDKDMNMVIASSDYQFIARFPFQGWTGNGIPRYDINKCDLVARVTTGLGSVAVDKQGQVFAVSEAATWRWMKEKPALTAHGSDGQLRWSIPVSEDPRPMDKINGECIIGPLDLGGEIGEVISLTQWHGLHLPLITTDGLFIGRVLRDPAEGGEPGPDMYRGETIQYLNKLDDGRVILAHGKNAHHLLQITGLEAVRRFNGDFALTPAQAQQAAARLQAKVTDAEAAAPIRITRGKAPITVDGKLDEWDWTTASSIGPKTGAPRAEVALRAGDKETYVAFKVYKAGPFLNTGKDDPFRLFLTGDAVDLQFSTDPAANPARKTPALGDCRLLFSAVDGQPVAVLYRALVPNAKAPVAFSSPVRSVIFDEVSVLKDARVVITNTTDGYLVEAAIPNQVLGDLLWPGRSYQGDAGIIVADKTGRRVARIYRFNQGTQLVSDVPTEATLNPDQWGTIVVDPEKK